MPGAVDEEQRAVANADIARVLEMPGQIVDERRFVVAVVALLQQDFPVVALPCAGPVFVGPHDHERKIEARIGQNLFHRLFKNAFAVKPIMIEAKAVNARLPRHFDLPPVDIGLDQIIAPKIARDFRLDMALEPWLTARQVAPFGKAFAPEIIIFRDRMELRQKIGQHLRPRLSFQPDCRVEFLEQLAGACCKRMCVIGRVVGRASENWQLPALFHPPLAVMHKRVHSRRENIGMGGQIEAGRKPRRRIAPLVPADIQVMLDRISRGLVLRETRQIEGDIEIFPDDLGVTMTNRRALRDIAV